MIQISTFNLKIPNQRRGGRNAFALRSPRHVACRPSTTDYCVRVAVFKNVLRLVAFFFPSIHSTKSLSAVRSQISNINSTCIAVVGQVLLQPIPQLSLATTSSSALRRQIYIIPSTTRSMAKSKVHSFTPPSSFRLLYLLAELQLIIWEKVAASDSQTKLRYSIFSYIYRGYLLEPSRSARSFTTRLDTYNLCLAFFCGGFAIRPWDSNSGYVV